MTEEEVRSKVAEIAGDYCKRHVIIAVPAIIITGLEKDLNKIGLKIEVVDDGEDDGIPALAAVPNSDVMNTTITTLHARFIGSMVFFVAWAVVLVATIAWHSPQWVTGACGALMAMQAMLAVHTHRLREIRQTAQNGLRKGGV